MCSGRKDPRSAQSFHRRQLPESWQVGQSPALSSFGYSHSHLFNELVSLELGCFAEKKKASGIKSSVPFASVAFAKDFGFCLSVCALFVLFSIFFSGDLGQGFRSVGMCASCCRCAPAWNMHMLIYEIGPSDLVKAYCYCLLVYAMNIVCIVF